MGDQLSMNQVVWKEYIKALKNEVKPALGCTEPISLALAAAKARAVVGDEDIISIVTRVSPNLMKNGMGVTVPGTGMKGLAIAAAAGAICGDAEAGLEVLKNINESHVKAAKQLLDQNLVSVSISDIDKILYSEAEIKTANHIARVCIADTHTKIVRIEKDGAVIFEETDSEGKGHAKPYDLTGASIAGIYDFCTNAPINDIAFMKDAETINNALSVEGLTNDYGLHIGKTMLKQLDKGFIAKDLMTDIMIRTSAGSDARMGGATLPAMSNSGSGNQGISATMPVVVVADFLKASEEDRIRAQALSHLVAVYIHNTFPALSALCATSTAAMGAAAGMGWLLGDKKLDVINDAICSMIGDVSGIICDGAANSCAMKVSSTANSAFKAVIMALDNVRVTGQEGLVSPTVEESIRNLGNLVTDGMKQTDEQIIKIMINKSQC